MPRPKIQRFLYELAEDVTHDDAAWHARQASVPLNGHEPLLQELLNDLAVIPHLSTRDYHRIMRAYARRGLPWLSKSQLLKAYEALCAAGERPYDPALRTRLQVKPVRSQAGVSVVTVLTKPYPCPGECIFCPTDVRMPKSYLHDEPGAQRAERYAFDPHDQTAGRILTLEKLGHPTGKIELLILGGTWSSYPRDYQEWFVRRCFEAMNGRPASSLAEAHAANENAEHRCVGLVVETRQDHIDIDELRWLRRLGVTKVQVGIQTMDDRVLRHNRRGHDGQATREAFRLLRLAGFKIHGHWMANLLGATPAGDRADYDRLWQEPALRPDELKIYPCMLLENTTLYQNWLRGEFRPYDEEELVDLLVHCLTHTPRYARLTRVFRDIPTTRVVAGVRKANLRQIAETRLRARGLRGQDIRAREIRRETVSPADLTLCQERYDTVGTTEIFLSYETEDTAAKAGRIAAFLRLSLPDQTPAHPLPELAGCAMIREVHVYGPALEVGDERRGVPQHAGLGSALIAEAARLAAEAGYDRLAVISAVGTRSYYERFGFCREGLYMVAPLEGGGKLPTGNA